MRALSIVGSVLLTLGLAAPAAGQDAVRPLQRLIDFSFPVRADITDCTVPSAVAGLARRFEFLAGIEYLRSPCAKIGGEGGSAGPFIDLRGLTVEDALAKLLTMDARYRLVEHDGVLVVRPVQAWSDPRNILNFSAPSFALHDATLGAALEEVIAAMVGETPRAVDRLGESTEQGARRFTVKSGMTSAGAALDAIVRAHGAAIWQVREGEVSRSIFFYTFDGSGIGSSRRGLQ